MAFKLQPQLIMVFEFFAVNSRKRFAVIDAPNHLDILEPFNMIAKFVSMTTINNPVEQSDKQ